MEKKSLSDTLASVRKGVGRGLVVIGAGAVLSTVALAAARYNAIKADRQLPSEFVLEVPLDRLQVVDALDPSPLAFLQGNPNKVELPKVVSALKRAAKDERCRGLVTYVGDRGNLAGLATAQELRDALLSFRTSAAAAGRAVSTAAFAATYGEAGQSGMVPYLVASACEKIFMQPSGLVGLTGLESRAFFIRGLMDKLRAEPVVFAREEFKSALNPLRERGFTGPQKENLSSLLGDMADQMVAAMGSGRRLTPEAVRAAVEEAPLLPAQALAARLLDGTKYRDEVQSLFPISDQALQKEKEKEGRKHKRRKDDIRMARVSLDRYIQLTELQQAAELSLGGPRRWWSGTAFEGLAAALSGKLKDSADTKGTARGPPGRPKVAVVTATGPIVQGPVPPGRGGQQVIDASRVAGHLATLLEDPDVRAVVVRVNSPGGSALASDTIYHELVRLRDAGKKVVVSMGDVAASGGYYIAAAADRIVAQPGTLTGSIGVVAAKINVAGTLEEAGVSTDSVAIGGNADLLSPFKGLTPQQETRIEHIIDHVYDDFLDKVSRSRGWPVHEVRQLAKGRVYTGRQAHEVGLVDELGGLEAAVQSAKELAGLPEDAPAVDYPPRRVPLLLRLLRNSGMVPEPGGPGAGGAGMVSSVVAAADQGASQSGPLAAALGWLLLGATAGWGGVGPVAVGAVATGPASGGPTGLATAAQQLGGSLALLGSGQPQMVSVEASLLSTVV